MRGREHTPVLDASHERVLKYLWRRVEPFGDEVQAEGRDERLVLECFQ